MRYFGTNGVRGKFDALTPELAMRISQAIGLYFKSGKIILARDCRITGEVLRSAVASGLASVGSTVIDIGVASSPTAEYMIKAIKADGCIIVSASHNPPEWNALKVVDGRGVSISKERGEEIEKIMDGIVLSQWDKVGKITHYDDATENHIDAIKGYLNRKEIRKKIVLDCGNGTACLIAPKLFKELGCEILTLNSHPDGRFPGRPSEPTEENVKELIALVKSSKADAGIAWDGDGDRVIFVDEKGAYIIGDKVYALSILWKEGKGDVVTTVATSKAVEDIAITKGHEVRYTAIGAPYLCQEMMKKAAFIGGEEVGGVIWPELSMAKDGFLTAAMMAQSICEKPLSQWMKQIPVYYNVKHKIKADERRKKEIVSRVVEHAKKKKLEYVSVDGVRINLKDGWVIVRASGTEEYVRVFAEAKSQDGAKKLVEEYEKIALGE